MRMTSTMTKPASLDPELASLWDEFVPQVSPKITPLGLEALCIQVQSMRTARQRVDEEGMLIEDAKGNAMPHPGIAIAKAAQVEIRNWITKFGVRS